MYNIVYSRVHAIFLSILICSQFPIIILRWQTGEQLAKVLNSLILLIFPVSRRPVL